jgi:hypothetical protein
MPDETVKKPGAHQPKKISFKDLSAGPSSAVSQEDSLIKTFGNPKFSKKDLKAYVKQVMEEKRLRLKQPKKSNRK